MVRGTNVYLFLTGMMLLAELARQGGLFDWLAVRVAALANGSASRLLTLVLGSARWSPCSCPIEMANGDEVRQRQHSQRRPRPIAVDGTQAREVFLPPRSQHPLNRKSAHLPVVTARGAVWRDWYETLIEIDPCCRMRIASRYRITCLCKGCIKGAVVGGVAGHLAGHGALGAVGGCAVGHHMANKAAPASNLQQSSQVDNQNHSKESAPSQP